MVTRHHSLQPRVHPKRAAYGLSQRNSFSAFVVGSPPLPPEIRAAVEKCSHKYRIPLDVHSACYKCRLRSQQGVGGICNTKLRCWQCQNERDDVVQLVVKKIVQNLERRRARRGEPKFGEGDDSSSFGDPNHMDLSLPEVNDSLLEHILEGGGGDELFVDTSTPTALQEG